LPPTTSGLETEWDYSGRKGRDGQKKKLGKANERKEKVKRGRDEEVNGQGEKRGARPHTGPTFYHNSSAEMAMQCCIFHLLLVNSTNIHPILQSRTISKLS